MSFCVHFTKSNVQRTFSWCKNVFWQSTAFWQRNAKKKGKSKKESIFTSAILTFYQVKTKYYVFCEQNAEVCINIGF